MLSVVRAHLISGLLGQALAQANVLWAQASQEGRCEELAEEWVDLITASMAHADEVTDCIGALRRRSSHKGKHA